MKKNRDKLVGLTEKEEKELEMLDDPNVEFFTPSFNPIWWLVKDKFKSRKERVVKLRIKKRMAELNLNPQKDFGEYYRIMEEEEKRFDERFNKKFERKK